ncbi:putative membrane protein [Altererythrobacter atlanticus]|uniref:Uncharacterized protein n=1 Tax=Croceibacterium atlanticum TaxID=1267766 RepID=A0A0F7KTU1_9SPHN|nr:DUF2254 domain-containing protein [Croceibacterium atlanticum]AKH42571.1 hypothetical protein WYH_01532 [Croceibacterium atlanticum]MBB5731348.1 putative membrane protein [Croceibacterium atlanticum]
MTAEIRWLWSRLNANYWFYPALFALGAGVLAFGTVWLDHRGAAQWLNDTNWILPARPEGASNLLTVIAGSMIGVASTVFSITIAAVAYASGNYGPRLLTNFMEDRGNQLSLATFIGTFVYALITLRAVRAEDEAAAAVLDSSATSLPGFVPQLSLVIAFLLMGLSIAVLVFFLNHIPASIRINTVLKGIGRRLLEDIADAFPEDANGAEDKAAPDGPPILADQTGYVRLIDFDEIKRAADDAGCRIALEVRTGDFIHAGMALARVCSGEPKEGLEDDVRAAFSVGASRSAEQDPQFLIDELVEIGLRALSPGINDPFTAITALHWLGAATAELGRRDLRKRVGGDEPEERSVIPLPDDFEHYVDRGFGVMRSAIATSRIAALVMLDTLRNAAAPIQDESRQALLRREGDRLLEQARNALTGPDLQEVEARHVSFSQAFLHTP